MRCFQDISSLNRLVPKVFEVAEKTACGIFLVGGAVRDLLLGRDNISDYDFVCRGDFGLFRDALFSEVKFREVLFDSKGFDTRRFCFQGVTMDFQSMRGENPGEDARKRDFSVNALYMQKTERGYIILDPYKGLADLEQHVIREVSGEALTADPLRILRAFRFASQLDFEIHDGTARSASRHKELLAGVSKERIVYELKVLFSFPRKRVIQTMVKTGVLETILGFEPPEKLPAFFDGDIENIHEICRASGRGAAGVLSRYGFSNKDRELAGILSAVEDKEITDAVGAVYRKDPALLKRAAAFFYGKDAGDKGDMLMSASKNRRCILNGNEVGEKFGLSGVQLGSVLKAAHIKQILEEDMDREQLLRYVVEELLAGR